ncbi:type IV pilus biogenesis protein PilP [Paraburkholderia sp. 2C]
MKNDRARRVQRVLGVVALAGVIGFSAAVRAQTAAPGSAPVAAAVVPTPAAAAAANELMHLQEDTVVLKAQLKKLDAQQQVAEREAALNRMGRTITYDEISVLATQSLGDTISATVDVNGAGEYDVHQGDTLANGMRVMSIRPGSVIVEGKDGHRTTLTVMSARKAPSRVAAAGAMNGGVPPIPTLSMPTR